jgi:hypothetical protein
MSNFKKIRLKLNFMKILYIFFFGSLLIFLTATCGNPSDEDKSTLADKFQKNMEVTGTIQQQGITSYQYGTHTLSNDDSLYALKSEVVNLDRYVDREVTLQAKRIEGYPIDGGPNYLLVLQVIE